MPKKCILILLDGLGDRSFPELGNQTPLQAADTPALDKLAAAGSCGLYHAAFQGQALPSENAHFSLFGYDMADFPGRGSLEALGLGIDISPDEVALLSHFVNLSEQDGTLVLEKGKPDAQTDEIDALTESIQKFDLEEVKITFHPAGGIRGILRMHGDVSPYITDSDPFLDGKKLCAVMPWHKAQEDPAARKTARVLRAYLIHAYKHLNAHPVNINRKKRGLRPLNGLTTQRAGRLKQVEPFEKKYGMQGIVVASGLVYWGLSAFVGMDVMKVTDTGNPGKDIEKRINMATAELGAYDFIHVHTKTPDEAAHTKDPLFKKSVIESLDRGIGRAIQPLIDDPDILVIVTADHSTPSNGPLIHSGESVPLVFRGGGVRQDNVKQFDEISMAQGALGMVRGKELMYLILNHLERAKLAGIMDTPVDQAYWPGNYEPFKLEPVPKKT